MAYAGTLSVHFSSDNLRHWVAEGDSVTEAGPVWPTLKGIQPPNDPRAGVPPAAYVSGVAIYRRRIFGAYKCPAPPYTPFFAPAYTPLFL